MLLLLRTSTVCASIPLSVELVESRKIWDQAPHNAFTDLAHWNDSLYCAFRQGRGHVSTDGKIRIIRSIDANSWEPAALVALDGYDLRDAHLSVTPEEKLMLLGGAAPRSQDNQAAPTGTFVSFSRDGTMWTAPQIVVRPGRWLWSVTWHDSKTYGFSYAASDDMPYLDLLSSTDGVNYQPHISKILGAGYPTEAALKFDRYGSAIALLRRDKRFDNPCSAMLGISRQDYTQWQWHDLGSQFDSFGGPNLICLPTGYWIGAGRMHQDGPHTALTFIDISEQKMTKLIKLPSGGDTSYPGLVWHDDRLYVSYYSSHEGKSSIYLAKLKVGYVCPQCRSTMRTVPMEVGLPTAQMHELVKKGKALLAGCMGDPRNPEIAGVCTKCRRWKTAYMKYWQPLPEEFGSSIKEERSQQ